MDAKAIEALMSTVGLIASTLDVAPDSWRDHLQPVRNITATLDFSDSTPDEGRKRWQVPLIGVFQQVAFADADHGGILDISNWCLRQTLTLLQVYPQDPDLLALIGQNWLLRAQRSLARIHHTEQNSLSSVGSQEQPLSASEEQRQINRSAVEAEDRLHSSDYVEARGILLPAVEYFKHAVDAASARNVLDGNLLAKAAEAFMSLGNVSSTRVNGDYFHQALVFLQKASEMPGYAMPVHLQQYLDEYGPLDLQG